MRKIGFPAKCYQEEIHLSEEGNNSIWAGKMSARTTGSQGNVSLWGFTILQNIYLYSFLSPIPGVYIIRLVPWLKWVTSKSYCRQTRKLQSCTSSDTNYSIWENFNLAEQVTACQKPLMPLWIYRASSFQNLLMFLKAGKKWLHSYAWNEHREVLQVKDMKSTNERIRMNSSIPHEGTIQQTGLNLGAIFCITFDMPKILLFNKYSWKAKIF